MKIINKGFTLVELVIVIVILGILAVSAIPKFVDIKSDANIAALQTLKGAFKSANQLVYSKAVINGVSTNYDETTVAGQSWDKDCTENACVEVEGVYLHLKNAYIDQCDIAFAIDADINRKSTRTVGNKNIADPFDTDCNSGTFKGKTCEYEYCQCRLQSSSNTTQVFLVRGTSFDSVKNDGNSNGKYKIKSNTCAITYQSAATKIGGKPVYNIYTDGC